MSYLESNGANLYYEMSGASGDPLVLVHGSWGDHHNWDAVVAGLAQSFRVVTYDRRGHSMSERPTTQGSIEEDVDDLAAIVEQLHLAPAHVVGNSGGAAIALRFAAKYPHLCRSLIVHEPPLFGLLEEVPEAKAGLQEVGRRIAAVRELLEAGDDEAAAQRFVETIAFGPGEWQHLPEPLRQTFIFNAPTFLDEQRDPAFIRIDLKTLANYDKRALVTHGTTSAPFFPIVAGLVKNALRHAEESVFAGAGHVPHLSHPAEFVREVVTFSRSKKSTD